MALFLNKWGDIRGKVADLVFSANAAGSYIRSKVTPINPQTQWQQAARSVFSSLASWYSHNLSDSQRQSWSDLAEREPYKNIFGETKKMSALSLFIKANYWNQVIGFTLLQDAPNNMAVRPVTITAFTGPTVASREFSLTVSPVLSDDEAFLLYSTASQPTSINFVKNLYRYSSNLYDQIANPYVLPITEKVGTLRLGQKVHALVVRYDKTTGGMSNGVPITHIITA